MLVLQKFYLLTVGFILEASLHRVTGNTASKTSSNPFYVDYLMEKYSKDHTRLNLNEINHYLDEYLYLFSPREYAEHKLDCFKLKLVEFKTELNNENVSRIEFINSEQLHRLNTFLVANFDKCYSKIANKTSKLIGIYHNRTENEKNTSYTSKVFSNALKIPKQVYFYASVSVITISVIGIVCVVIVPLLNKCCFDYVFQFLTALALGTLCGDAFLHLIPHVFMKSHAHEGAENRFDKLLMPKTFSHDADSEQHNSGIYKGLAVLVGIYSFFIIETLLQITKSSGQIKNEIFEKNYRTNVTSDRRNSRNSFDEFDELTKNQSNQAIDMDSQYHKINMARTRKRSATKNMDHMSTHDNNLISPDETSHRSLPLVESNESKSPIVKIKRINSLELLKRANNSGYTMEYMHGHSHNANLKSSLWMVIFGDCLHNFSDGLAIGASFTSSLTTGFGTTMAIFFHELPHEIGDFAVLKKNGVSTRNAIYFNILSSVLSFFGCFVGLVIGSIDNLSNWSFLVIAGTFIYISLVDLIPELHEFYGINKQMHFFVFFLQNLGILFGIVLMFTIAIYEDDIVNLIRNIKF